MAERWRRCSACKGDIALGATYWVCNVSTCNRKRTGLVFCSVDCWEIHLPTERHRESWAVEKQAPKTHDAPEPAAPRRESAGSAARSPRPGSKSDRPAVLIRKAASESGAAPHAGSSAGSAAPAVRATGGGAPARGPGRDGAEDEILVVASKLKAYVRERSGFNTSDRVLSRLSDALRQICDRAIRNAREAERLTVLDRDVPRD